MGAPVTPTVAQALAQALSLGMDRLEAQTLLGQVLGQERAWLLAHDGDHLSAAQHAHYGSLLRRRLDDEPIAYLRGWQEFHGLRLRVNASTLVPRPDTETLVDWALELLQQLPREAQVLDLGTGSGAIALALKHRRPDARVTATDQSEAALSVAQGNGVELNLEVEWRLGNWWQALAHRHFDLIVSNPPYIAANDRHLPALRHEPLSALTPGGDGLDALREISRGAPTHLKPGGWLLLEHGFDQADAVASALLQAGFPATQLRRDLSGNPRCTGAQTPH